MADYRLYCLDRGKKISRAADWIEARSDDEALVIARAMKLPINCELWHRDRLVAEIPACSEHANSC